MVHGDVWKKKRFIWENKMNQLWIFDHGLLIISSVVCTLSKYFSITCFTMLHTNETITDCFGKLSLLAKEKIVSSIKGLTIHARVTYARIRGAQLPAPLGPMFPNTKSGQKILSLIFRLLRPNRLYYTWFFSEPWFLPWYPFCLISFEVWVLLKSTVKADI